MKNKFLCKLLLATVLTLTACSGAGVSGGAAASSGGTAAQAESTAARTGGTKGPAAENTDGNKEGQSAEEKAEKTAGSRILIAYFSIPEDIRLDGVDANSGASVVVRDGEALGNVQYMAQTIQETIGGDLFRIETIQQYPLDHEPLVDQAADEQDEEARPELAAHLENADQYDVVFLGYPNWWGDLPMPLYTFLEETDLSGTTIIPFCPHGGSGFSRTEATIARLQPEHWSAKTALPSPEMMWQTVRSR